MTHNHFVALAYAVFGLVLAWDYVAPQVRLKSIRRSIAQRTRRDAARKKP